MSRDETSPRRTVLLSFRFLGPAIAGTVIMSLVAAFGPLSAHIAVLGAFVSILGGLFVSYMGQEDQRERERAKTIESLSVPLLLARDPELFHQYEEICRSLTALAKSTDPILRQIATLKFTSVASQIDGLAEGRVVFAMTEEWRTVYEHLLASADVRQYRSVAWVQSPEYWQDEPGQRSMRANFDAAHRGTHIERVVVLRDSLWPREQALPSREILPWIDEQHKHGLWIMLVRESELGREPDLLVDMGIYGDRAIGIQDLDEACRTLRFTLDLNPQAVRLAKARWERVVLYGRSYRSLLDQLPSNG